MVALLRRAADQAALIGDYALVNALLAAALRLVDPADDRHADRACTPAGTPRCYSLGRLEEADEDYRMHRAAVPDRAGRAPTRRRCRCAA